MLSKDKGEAVRSIDFLNKKIEETSISDMKTIFYELIEEQTKKLMLTEVTDEYVLSTLSEAKIPEEPVSPKRLLIVIASAFLSALTYIIILLIITMNSRNRGIN